MNVTMRFQTIIRYNIHCNIYFYGNISNVKLQMSCQKCVNVVCIVYCLFCYFFWNASLHLQVQQSPHNVTHPPLHFIQGRQSPQEFTRQGSKYPPHILAHFLFMPVFCPLPNFSPTFNQFPPLWASHKNIFVNAVFASVTRDFIHVLLTFANYCTIQLHNFLAGHNNICY